MDRSMRAVLGLLITENLTRQYNRQTSIYHEEHSQIYY